MNICKQKKLVICQTVIFILAIVCCMLTQNLVGFCAYIVTLCCMLVRWIDLTIIGNLNSIIEMQKMAIETTLKENEELKTKCFDLYQQIPKKETN